MKTRYFHIDTLDDKQKKEIDTILNNGGVVAFPTETVYGIGCSIDAEIAIKRLYELKNRPEGKAFTVHMGSIDQLSFVANKLDAKLSALINHFCPGPVTFVVPKKKGLSSMIGTEDSVGVRVPDHPKLCELISFHNKPFIGTSANLSSLNPATEIDEVIKYFDGKIDIIIDGGKSDRKVPSTVISLIKEPFQILRKGDISLEEVISVYNQIQGDGCS